MPTTGEDVIVVNYEGNVAAKTREAADGVEKLANGIGRLNAAKETSTKKIGDDADRAAKSVKRLSAELAAAKKEAAARDATAFAWANKTPTALQGPPPAFSAFQKLLGSINSAMGPKAAEGFVKGAGAIAQAGETLAPVAPALVGAGSALLAAGVALGAATGALLAAGMKFSIEKASQKELQKSIFGALGNEGGFDLALNLAAKFNIDEGKAIETVKTLMQSKLGDQDIEVFTKIAVGIGAVRGEGKAQAFIEKLAAQMAKGGKASEDSIKGFAEAGINVDKVWAALAAKLGVSVDQAKSKVKAGAVDMRAAMDAVKVAAEQDFGAVADKMGGSVPGLLNALKIQFGQLFADVDMGPLKEMLGGLMDVLKGDAGGELKKAVTELFGNLGEALFGAFKGEQGKAKMQAFIKDVSAGIKELSAVIKALTPTFHAVESAVLAVAGKGPGFVASWLSVIQTVQGVVETLSPLIDVFMAVQGAVGSLIGAVLGPFQFFFDLITGGAEQASSGGSQIGSNLISGIVSGFLGGEGGLLGSVMGVIQRAIGAAQTAADAHSPSRAMAKLGGWMSEGLAVGMAGNDNATAAASGAVNSAMNAAAGAGAQAPAAGAKAGGPGGGVTVIVNLGAGGAGVSAADLKKLEEAAYEGTLRAMRAMGREAREGSRAA